MASAKKSKRSVKRGILIIVGGHEDKENDLVILKEIAARTGKGKLIVATLASQVADELWNDYREIFKKLGVQKIEHFSIEQPSEARNPALKKMFEDAKTVFFTGGDQLKITSKIGGTPVTDWIREIYENGGTIAGTSAGASVMGKEMLIGGENVESHKVGNWMMAPGLGLLPDMIVDQHFAQRGRIGRLLGAIAPNRGLVGIGIDEDTAVVVEGGQFRVMGSGAVYVVDGRNVSYTNISETASEKTMSLHHVQLHVLGQNDVYDLVTHEPICPLT